MGNLYEALGFLGMLCGLTVIADRLTSKETRKLIGENIRSALEHPRNPKFTNPVSFIEKIRPFSLRSLLTSFAFSIYALTIVLYIQYFMFGYDFSDIYKGVDGVHIKDFTLFLIFIVFSNFFVDFLSFTQTLVLIRLINRGQSRSSIIIVFITDLLSSINIFTFTYAAFLAIGLIYIVNGKERSNFVVKIEKEEITDEVREAIDKIEKIDGDFSNQYTLELYAINPNHERSTATAYVVSQHDLDVFQLQNLLRNALQSLYPTDDVSLISATGIAEPEETGYWNPVEYEMSGSIYFWWNEPLDFALWYSNAYLATDEVQDNFMAVATLAPGFQPVDLLRNSGNPISLYYSDPNYTFSGCGEKLQDSEECKNYVGAFSDDLGIFRIKITLSKQYGGSLPLYTFFFTSLSLTVTIYLFYISIFIMRYTIFIARKLSIPVSRGANLEEHPITVAAFPVILIATVIFYVAGL